jgi:hypothetical protein
MAGFACDQPVSPVRVSDALDLQFFALKARRLARYRVSAKATRRSSISALTVQILNVEGQLSASSRSSIASIAVEKDEI